MVRSRAQRMFRVSVVAAGERAEFGAADELVEAVAAGERAEFGAADELEGVAAEARVADVVAEERSFDSNDDPSNSVVA